MKYIQSKLAIIVFLVLIAGCEFSDVEDFQGAISGTVYDSNNNIVPADVTSNTLVVKLLGKGDLRPVEIRVKGDGTYQNTFMYPKKHKVWLEGPIAKSDTIEVDFSNNVVIEKDFLVLPHLAITNELVGTASSESVIVKYNIFNNSSLNINRRELYCSTVPYPTRNTGSGPFYNTTTVPLNADNGQAEITGLTPGTQYYIRIGASVSGNLMNYSTQIVIMTSGN